MKLTKINLGKGLTANLGDWNIVKPHLTLEAELEEGDDYQTCRRRLMDMVDAHLAEELEKHSED